MSKEDYLDIVFHMLDIKYYSTPLGRPGGPVNTYINTHLMDKLGILNIRVDLKANKFEKNSLRSIEQVNSIVSELFTEDELKTFLFMKSKNEPITKVDMQNVDAENGYSFKKWMYNLFEAITKYSGSNSIIKSAKTLLSQFTNNPLSIQSDAVLFSREELVIAGQIYEVISWLIGQETMKCLFAHMIKYTEYCGTFRFDITSIPTKEQLTASLNLFNIKPPTRGFQSLYVDLDRGTIADYLYSIFFLDSFMVLPTDKSISNDESVLFLGCSVLPYMGKNIVYDNYLDLQYELDNSFTEFYEYHFQDFYAYRGMSNVVGDVFFTSVQEALEVLMPEITKQVEAKYPTLSNSEKITLINQIFLAAEKELSNVAGDKINVRGIPVDNIRAQIEKLLNRDSYGDWITFYNVEVNGLPVKFYLTRDIFYGKEILTFGNRLFYNNKKMTYQDLDIRGRNKEAIKMRMDTVRKIIKDNGGKVKIYVAQNFGVDYGYGYQYIFSNGISDDKIPTKSPTSNDARCFVIDFTLNEHGKPVDPLANSKLEFLVSLSMTFSQPSHDRIFASDYLFDMKDFNSDYKSENSICLFDRRGFYSANDIHSYVKFSELKDVRFKSLSVKNVVFNGKDASFSELDKETGIWKDQGFLIISHKLLFGIYRINRWW